VAQLLALDLEADLLFLDDNSPDGTGQVLDELAAVHPRLKVIHRSGKLGIGSAHVAGICWAYDQGYQRLVTMDCDFTHSPSDVPRLLALSDQSPVVVGSRYMKKGSLPGWNLLRRFLTNFGHLLTRTLLGMPHDATGAFRVYDLARVPRQLFLNVESKGYSFFFESLFLVTRNKLAIAEVDIVLPARTYGHSKMVFRDAFRSAMRIVELYVATKLNPRQFIVSEPFNDFDPNLVDPQKWDEYLDQKQGASNIIYDVIATLYRNMIIKRGLNRAVRRWFAPGSKLLHAGCGSGQVDTDLQPDMAITAIDISPSALRMYKRNNPNATSIRHADLFNLPFESESFDGAYNLGVVEHFTHPQIGNIFRQMARVVRPGGHVVIFWPHQRATSAAVLDFAHWVMNKVLGKQIQFHPPEISRIPSRQAVEHLFQDAGFEIVHFEFGPRDFWVQAVVVARKRAAGGG